MGLASAAQARANTTSEVPTSAAAYYSNNAYVPTPSGSSAAPVTAASPPTKTKSTLGRLFSKKSAPAPSPAPPAGPPNGGASVAGNSRDWFDAIYARLQATVEANKLQSFYRPNDIQNLTTRVWNTVNIEQLARRWRIPKELALDLISLALYDVVLFGDDSGSMTTEGGGRIQDLTYIVAKVTEIAVLFDDDGISVRFINSAASLDNCKSDNQISELFSKVEYKYGTKLGTKMQNKILDPLVFSPAKSGSLKKPVVVITITDGEPTQEPDGTVVKVISQAKRYLQSTKYGGGAVAFQFAQVGTDLTAQAFLKMLDDHSEVGNMVDCTSAFELEQEECMRKGIELSPEVWLIKLMCGAIDPQYDSQD